MKKQIPNDIKKYYGDVLFEKLDNACDLLEHYDNNDDVAEFLNDIIKLFESMDKANRNRQLLLKKLDKIKNEGNHE